LSDVCVTINCCSVCNSSDVVWVGKGCWVKGLSVLRAVFSCCYVGEVILTGRNSAKQTQWDFTLQKVLLTTGKNSLKYILLLHL